MIKGLYWIIWLTLVLSVHQVLAATPHEVSFKFGGWSHHTDELSQALIHASGDEDWQFNEDHNGYGLDYAYKFNRNWQWFSGFFQMKDSYNHRFTTVGSGFRYRYPLQWLPTSSVDFNLSLMFLKRGQLIDRSSYQVSRYNTKLLRHDYSIDSASFTYLMPYITVNIMDKFNVDLMVLPAKKSILFENINGQLKQQEETPTTYFMRFGIRF